MDALAQKVSKLPQVAIDDPGVLIGKTLSKACRWARYTGMWVRWRTSAAG